MAVAKVYVGGSWVEAKWKDYDGSDWVERGKVWDGSAWVDIGGVEAVQFDSVGAGADHASAPSWSHTLAEQGRVVVVGFLVSDATPTVSGAVGGEALSLHSLVVAGAYSGPYLVWAFVLTRDVVTVGTKTVTLSIGGGAIAAGANSIAYANAGPLGAVETHPVNLEASSSISVDVAAGGMAVAAAWVMQGELSSFNQTHRHNHAGTFVLDIGDTETPGNQAFTWGYATHGASALLAVPINPA